MFWDKPIHTAETRYVISQNFPKVRRQPKSTNLDPICAFGSQHYQMGLGTPKFHGLSMFIIMFPTWTMGTSNMFGDCNRSGCLQKLPVARGQRIGNGKAFFTSTMVPWPKTWPFLMVGVSWVTRSTMKYPRYAYWLTAAGLKRTSRYVEIDLDIYLDSKIE